MSEREKVSCFTASQNELSHLCTREMDEEEKGREGERENKKEGRAVRKGQLTWLGSSQLYFSQPEKHFFANLLPFLFVSLALALAFTFSFSFSLCVSVFLLCTLCVCKFFFISFVSLSFFSLALSLLKCGPSKSGPLSCVCPAARVVVCYVIKAITKHLLTVNQLPSNNWLTRDRGHTKNKKQ